MVVAKKMGWVGQEGEEIHLKKLKKNKLSKCVLGHSKSFYTKILSYMGGYPPLGS